MTAARVRVITAGLLTTVQDLGRWGWQSSGVSVSGPMDPRALRLSNALVGNGPDAAVLEITLAGPELEFDEGRTVAVCGAEFALYAGPREVPLARAVSIRSGDRLRFGPRVRGARAYLAVEGGFAVPSVLGSRATHAASRLGGHEGRALVAGDVLPIGSRRSRPAALHRGDPEPLELPGGHARLRVLPGRQDRRFPPRALAQLQSAPFTVRQESNRMGYRLAGPRVDSDAKRELLSSPTVLGALQVPPDGHPILLMADRQPTGGYPTIATVIGADIGLAGQLTPGDRVWFEVCTPREALAALVAQERRLMRAEAWAS
jgi:antagonist of KipI